MEEKLRGINALQMGILIANISNAFHNKHSETKVTGHRGSHIENAHAWDRNIIMNLMTPDGEVTALGKRTLDRAMKKIVCDLVNAGFNEAADQVVSRGSRIMEMAKEV